MNKNTRRDISLLRLYRVNGTLMEIGKPWELLEKCATIIRTLGLLEDTTHKHLVFVPNWYSGKDEVREASILITDGAGIADLLSGDVISLASAPLFEPPESLR